MTQNIDWNDVANTKGVNFVRHSFDAFMAEIQLSASESSPAPSLSDYPEASACLDESPAPPEMDSGEISIDLILKRYLLIYGTNDVWDTHLQSRLKKTAFGSLVGREVAKKWYDSPDKRLVHPDNVGAAIAAKQKQIISHAGGMGVGEALSRFTYLYPSKTVWDHSLREIVNIDDLKCAMPDLMDIWIRHPERKQILKRNLVFDPTQSTDPATHINMFVGLPLSPVHDIDKCHAIRELSYHLCNYDPKIWEWLICWMAYPLQHVGAKMATAVLMHSEVHGSGKSLLFDGVMRPIYGEYGATLGQHQMETPYTDWQSNVLYGLFEELFSRDGKDQNLGKLKQMITGDKVRIEKKFVSSWEEANHMNSVFLSNEIMPFPVEPSDRRFLVVWPEEKLPEDLQSRVDFEIKNGGIEAFYGWLLNFPLGGFTPHTKPIVTEAKERLIEFCRPGWENFCHEWQQGYMDVPYETCAVNQLYEVYKNWCGKNKESCLGRNKFSNLMSRRVKLKKNQHYEMDWASRQAAFFVVGSPPDGVTNGKWLGNCYEKFQKLLEKGDSP